MIFAHYQNTPLKQMTAVNTAHDLEDFSAAIAIPEQSARIDVGGGWKIQITI